MPLSLQPPPPSSKYQFLRRWNNLSEQAKRAAENATQSATDETRPEPSGSSEVTTMMSLHLMRKNCQCLEKIRRQGVELREKKLKERFREILLEEKKVKDRVKMAKGIANFLE
ncbi:hypothetical protein Peur_029579 [Populus x canadensis]